MAQSFRVDNFTSQLKGGGARPNLFQMQLSNLPTFATIGDNAMFSYMCRATDIPSSTIGTAPLPYFGREIHFAADREFAELTTTIINDEGHDARNMIESWMNQMNGMSSNKAKNSLGDRTNYTSTLILKTFKKDGADDQSFQFRDCWPSSVSAIDLNWDSTNTIMEFTVTWQYGYFVHPQANIISAA